MVWEAGIGSLPNHGGSACAPHKPALAGAAVDVARDAVDVAVVGAAAAAIDPQMRQAFGQSAVKRAELGRVAVVQCLGGVQLGMAEAGGVGAETADTLYPIGFRRQRLGEVVGMGAVDHVIGRGVAGLGVSLGDGFGQGLTSGETAIGLDCEGDH